MIEVDRILARALAFIWLALNINSSTTIDGKQNLSEFKKEDVQYGSKTDSQEPEPINNPEMVLLSGIQKNDLNLEPLKLEAPKDAYLSGPDEKPIVISVSNDKQVLSEENRMLPRPILVDGSLTNLELLRRSWLKNSTEKNNHVFRKGAQKVTTNPATSVQTKSRNSIITEEALDLGQLKRSEVKSKPAAIHKDLETAETSIDPMNNFNQTLSSDQLLCIIYKLLTMYKPNFTGSEKCPASAARSKVQKNVSTLKPSTLRPIDNALHNLALFKTSGSLRYKSLQNYDTPHPSDTAYETASETLKTGNNADSNDLSVQRAMGILDTLPLVKTFNKNSPSLSIDPLLCSTFSASGNRAYEGLISSTEDKGREHENQLNSSRNKVSTNNVKNQELELSSSNVTKKKLLTDLQTELPEEMLSIYLKLLEQLQEKAPPRQYETPQQSEVDLIKLLARTHTHFLNRNQSLTIPKPNFLSNNMKAHPDTIHENYKQRLLRQFNPSGESSDENAASKSISVYSGSHKSQKGLFRLADEDFNPSENFADALLKKSDHNGKKVLFKVTNKQQKQLKKKLKKRMQIRRKPKKEEKTKTHDFDFLDLLSRAMVRESRNFVGRI